MMSDHDQRSDDAFGERVGRVLRASERFGDHFEADLAAAIRNDGPRGRFVLRPRARGSAWWTTPITVRMSPLVGLAMAASVALVAVLSARAAHQSGATLIAIADTMTAPMAEGAEHLLLFEAASSPGFFPSLTGAIAIAQRYFKTRGRDFRTLGMRLFALVHAMEQWLWESLGLVG